MTPIIVDWPFLPAKTRAPQDTERWWRECYLPSPAEGVLHNLDCSAVLSGRAGSGKSVAAAALAREMTGRVLSLPYPVTRWPGAKGAWLSQGNHLRQLMACASRQVREVLSAEPQKLAALSDVKMRFLRWLIEKHESAYALRNWADDFEGPAVGMFLELPFDDLYSTDSESARAQGQIEALVRLAKRLGFESVLVLVDMDEADVEANLQGLSDLFGWLEPLQHRNFVLKATLPEQAVARAQIVDRSRGRVTVAPLRWSREACLDLANRHLRAATTGAHNRLSELADAALVDTLADEIDGLFGVPTPQGWVALAAALMKLYTTNEKRLTPAQQDDVVRAFYARAAPLRLDQTKHGVWRGPKLIVLDDQPFRFFELLWRMRGQFANEELLGVAGSQDNVSTLANRVRKEIEPVPSSPIYLHSQRGRGYWLENIVPQD